MWSPDGSNIAFGGGDLLDSLFQKPASGAGEEKVLLSEPGVIHAPTEYSHDGRFLLYYSSDATGAPLAQFVLPLDGSKKPITLVNPPGFGAGQGRLSPDMRWIAYVSTESGRREIYVRPFNANGPSLGEGKWQISRDGGSLPAWRADGKELFFRGPTGIMSAAVKAVGSAFEASAPERLFELGSDGGWDVAADGKRFLVSLANAQQNGQVPITVILNWQQMLKK